METDTVILQNSLVAIAGRQEEIIDHNGVSLVTDPVATFEHQKNMSNSQNSQLLDLFKITLEKGYRYVLCVECPSKSTLRQTNIDEEGDVARLLEKIARRARESA